MFTQVNLVHRLKRMDAQGLVYSHSVSEPGAFAQTREATITYFGKVSFS